MSFWEKKGDLLSATGETLTPPSHASKALFLLIQAQPEHVQSPPLAQPHIGHAQVQPQVSSLAAPRHSLAKWDQSQLIWTQPCDELRNSWGWAHVPSKV